MGTEENAGHHGGKRCDGFNRQIHVAGDDDDGQADGHDTDKGRLLNDVGEDADLEKVRDCHREDGKHEDKQEPDKIIENELDKGSLAGTHHEGIPIGFPGPLRAREIMR